MKILKSRVDPMEGFANDPQLYILVDKMPPLDELVYERKGDCYFAEKDGYVRFFFYAKPGPGYGGREFHIKVKEGDKVIEKVLKGPWSSRSGVMNKLGFTPCLEVAITDDPKVFERGHTFYAAAATVDLVKEALPLVWDLVEKIKFDDEVYYVLE